MKYTNYIKQILLVFSTFYVCASAAIENDLERQCENVIFKEIDKHESLQGKIEVLDSYEGACEETGFFHYQLGRLYIEAGNFDDALNLLNRGKGYKSSYEREIESSIIGLDYQKGTRQGDFDSEAVQRSLKGYHKFVEKYPNFYLGYEQLGAVYLVMQQHESAVRHSQKAIEINPNTPFSYRNLVVAHGQLDQYEKAIYYFNEVYRLEPDIILSEKDTVLTVALGYAYRNDYQTVQYLVGKLADSIPSVTKDEEFLRVTKFLRERFARYKAFVESQGDESNKGGE